MKTEKILKIFGQAVQKGYVEIFDAVKEEPKLEGTEFWVSSLPYCGLRDLFLKKTKPSDTYTTTLGYEHSSWSGTIIHKLIQKWLGTTKLMNNVELLGTWKCDNKDCNGTVEMSTYKKCPKCKGPTVYKEIKTTTPEGGGATLKLDGLLKYKDYYMILDYKSVSDYWLYQAISKKELPRKKDTIRVGAYGPLTRTTLANKLPGDPKIVGYIIVYVSREKPKNNYYVYAHAYESGEEKKILKKVKCAIANWKLVRKIVKKKFKIANSDLKELIEGKPCKSHEHYSEIMDTYYNPCPLAKDGLCWSKNLHKKVKQELK